MGRARAGHSGGTHEDHPCRGTCLLGGPQRLWPLPPERPLRDEAAGRGVPARRLHGHGVAVESSPQTHPWSVTGPAACWPGTRRPRRRRSRPGRRGAEFAPVAESIPRSRARRPALRGLSDPPADRSAGHSTAGGPAAARVGLRPARRGQRTGRPGAPYGVDSAGAPAGAPETRTGWSRAMPHAPWVLWARGPALRWALSSLPFRTRTRTSASTRRRPWRPSVRAPGGRRGALADALGDPVPGVRWAACEALGSIGPAAQSAVPRLTSALQDPFLYVRIFAAGALGSIGPGARSAREALEAATADPALHDEAEWALRRIAGATSPRACRVTRRARASRRTPNPGFGRPPPGSPPVDWDTATGRNIVWSVELGNETFGRPVVAGDAVYVGTDNARRRNPALQEESRRAPGI